MKKSAFVCYTILIVFLSAIYLPQIYRAIFFDNIEKTHLFYSPVIKDFIYKEKLVGSVPESVKVKAEDHHARISYQNSNGNYMSRIEFEKLLPFIYYKNLDIWGLLPLNIDGQVYGKDYIKKNRRVFELKSVHINGKSPLTPVWPLLESNPGQARLVFPDDRFRMTDQAMEFINADVNRVDTDLTREFTRALTDKGFKFPPRSVNGKFTVLKPFDEGVFLVDHNFQVFHVKRVNNHPQVIKTPIDPSIMTRHIKISENKAKQYYGLLLDHSGVVYLLSCENYRLSPLPLGGYDPDTMDLKLIFNPLYCTAVYSDDIMIHAVAMDRRFVPLASFSHEMSRGDITVAKQVYSALFPFTLSWNHLNSGFVSLNQNYSGLTGLVGIVISFVIYLAWMRISGRRKKFWSVLLVCITGIYGLVAIQFAGFDE